MEKKKSSYQKLKDKNKQLQIDIYNLIRNPETTVGIQTKIRHEMDFKLMDAVWFSEATHIDEKVFQGLVPRIKSIDILTTNNKILWK